MNFSSLINDLETLALPVGEYLIVGSGALAVRNIRDSHDLDIVVSEDLWNKLIVDFPVTHNEWGVEQIQLKNDIEILNPGSSIYGNSKVVSREDLFNNAEIIDGISYINLDHLKKIKLELGRDKDLQDVKLIEEYLNHKG